MYVNIEVRDEYCGIPGRLVKWFSEEQMPADQTFRDRSREATFQISRHPSIFALCVLLS
jgi:hypothetical protein